MRLQWIGGPTFLLRVGGFTLLADPMFATGPAAFVMNGHPSTGEDNVPIARLTALPPLDLTGLDMVLVSHLHSDHFDAVAKAQLDKRLPVIAPVDQAARLREVGFERAQRLDWLQSLELAKDAESLRILAVPARHSADEAVNADLGVVNGYLLTHRAAGVERRIYWTGDTVWFDGLEQIQAMAGALDLLLPHLGAVGTGGPWGRMTLNATEATQLVELFKPGAVIPIHHTTFSHYVEPVSAFATTLERTPYAASLVMLNEGETWERPPA
jgi:L-ascorbate metabolism protein UlaG (beta-lactamase superfamily)